jgi:4-hydroxybutyrate CoA-transferase
VLGVVVGLRGNGRDDETSCDAHGFPRSERGIRHVLEHLEERDTVEGVAIETKGRGVHLRGGQPREPADADCGEIRGTLLVAIDRGHLEVWKGIEERPEERAAPASDVEEVRRSEPCEHREHATNAREQPVIKALELVHLQASRKPLTEDLFIVAEDRRRQDVTKASAREGGTESDVVAIEGGIHGDVPGAAAGNLMLICQIHSPAVTIAIARDRDVIGRLRGHLAKKRWARVAPMEQWRSRAVSADEVVSRIRSGHHVFVHGASATPTPLLEALAAREDLEDVTLYHLHTSGAYRFIEERCRDRFRSVSLFVGPALRGPLAEGHGDFMPVFLSDIPQLFLSRGIPLDAALLQLSPPNRHGQLTLGTSVDAALAAATVAPIVLAEVNTQMPRTHGCSVVPLDRISAFTVTDRPLSEHPHVAPNAVEAQIGDSIAELVDDGACLQLGIGAIPDAVLARLGNKHDLGVHTEMFSDGLIPLVEGGVVTNAKKKVHPGRSVTSFVTGTRRLFDFVDDNQAVEFHPCDRTNDTALIRKNDRVVAINSAIEIDLTGQVCADSMGHRIYSGIGGQMDFIRGAALSFEGKPIIALPSTAAGGKVSRIVAELKPGAGVVTTRGHVHWVVTEYGAMNLHGKTLRERAEALISLAHPDFRAELRRQVANLRHFVL